MKRWLRHRLWIPGAVVGSVLAAPVLAAPQVRILLPLGRTVYQTNERIDVSVIRSDSAALDAGNLALTLAADDASKMAFTFPVEAVAADKGEARRTEHLHLNGRLLRPGKYALDVAADGAVAHETIEVYSHIRQSDFKTIDWGSGAKGREQAIEGEYGMGFNLLYPTGTLDKNEILRGGSDFLWCCTMSGAHQMDLRTECDWSDPYVLQGGEARVVRRALEDRTMPDCLGVHFYDEPGLTWVKDPKTGVMSPFSIPSQARSYKSDFGHDPLHYYDVKPDDAKAVAEWDNMNRWKEGFMPAAWKYAALGVSDVRPDFLSVTQSVYGAFAYADGYYFNVVRPLPVISGHGGYSDWGPAYYHPVWTLEMGRMRDLNKPTWYLPEWSENLPSEHYRLSQYLSFMTGVQGMAKPPGLRIQDPLSSASSDGLVEANKLMSRLGTIFTTMPPTRPPVAMLYALSQNLHAEVRDMQDAKTLDKAAYTGGGHSRDKTFIAWMAAQRIHQRLFPIVEEDVLDGELAAHHRVVILPGIDALQPKVSSALEAYIRGGGVVLVSDESKVQIKGAEKLGAPIDTSYVDHLNQLWQQGKQAEMGKIDNALGYFNSAAPVAAALQHHLTELGILPPIDADSPSIMTARQALGDIEYLFATNATYDPQVGERNSLKAAASTLSVADDGRPIYDAVRGGTPAEFKSQDKQLKGIVRFGAGEMRVFARTARPIGGVQVTSPTVFQDYTVENNPSKIEFTATLVDTAHDILSGSAPLEVRVIDPLGNTRYDLYRATDHGTLKLDLPIAANDPSGQWKVQVTELFTQTQGASQFSYHAPAQCGALAGATERAVVFGNDRDNIFRLFRNHQDATVVKGTSDYDAAAAQRIVEALKPWGVDCKIANASDVNKARPLTAEEAPTWVGLDPGRAEAGGKNAPSQVGFDLRGPAILVGTPEDNPLIKFEVEKKFLPYTSDAKDFPGRGRGYISWQRDAVGLGQESATLIAYDAQGMNEAVGTLYEAVAGLDPLMGLSPPVDAGVTPATKSTRPAPEAKIVWRAVLPDRAASIAVAGDAVKVATRDGSLTTIDPSGKVISSQEDATAAAPTPRATPGKPAPAALRPKVPDSLAKIVLSDRVVKQVAAGNGFTAIGYWGGTLQVFDANGNLKSQQQLPQDLTGIAWLSDKLIVGQSDGTVLALSLK